MAFKQKQDKFLVKIKPLKLEGLDKIITPSKIAVVAISVKWRKTKASLVINPFSRSSSMKKKINQTSSKKHVKHGEPVDWNDKEDGEFDSFCVDGPLDRWEVSFHVLYGENNSERTDAKLTVLGKVSINLSELAKKMDELIEKKIPITSKIAKVDIETVLTISVTMTEIKHSPDTSEIVIHSSSESNKEDRFLNSVATYMRSMSSKNHKTNKEDRFLNSVTTYMRSMSSKKHKTSNKTQKTKDDINVGSSSDMSEFVSSPILDTQVDTNRKAGFWKRRLSFGSRRAQIEPFIDKTSTSLIGDRKLIDIVVGDRKLDIDVVGDDRKLDIPASPDSTASDSKQNIDKVDTANEAGNCSTNNWVMKEIISRDSKETAVTKLEANVFFASFDQCSQQADGESACTILSILIAHWLLTNPSAMPTQSELDTLITQGSSEWRKLLQKNITNSPDNYFDLETVLKADIRPLTICPDKSYIGFFSPEKFKPLSGVMSFDEVWNIIKENDGVNVYIVSWKDHFFVLKVEADAYYVIDTLGQRLCHGCDKAYILKFDDLASMYMKGEKICEGKECFGEFMKRFLAAITVEELEEEDKKSAVSSIILHQRLQIEFQCMSL